MLASANLADEYSAPHEVCGMSNPDPKGDTAAMPQLGPSDAVSTAKTRPAAYPPVIDPLAHAFLAPPRAPDEIGRLGRYRVLGVLGQGGMGLVFRAEDPTLRRQVAIKVMLPKVAANPRANARFVREARAQAAIEHDHVIPIFDIYDEHDPPFFSMPLLKGVTLAAALKANQRPPLAAVVRIGREIAAGLAAAHKIGLIHRDIKPTNVWLEGDQLRVKVLDFGLARSAGEDTPGTPGDEPVTAEGAVVGTPQYMSPEQARGEPLDARTDLFSLGVVLYEMTTGHLPFVGNTPTAVLLAVASYHPTGLAEVSPTLPPPLAALITRLLAKDATGRPATAAAVAAELGQIELGLTAALPVRVIALDTIPGAGSDPWAGMDSTEPEVAVVPAKPPGRAALGWAALGLAVLIGGGLLAGILGKTFAPRGTLAVHADDPNLEVVVKQNGKVIRDRTREREFVLPPGEYMVEPAEVQPGLKIKPDRATVGKDGREVVSIWREKPKVTPKPKSEPASLEAIAWVLKVGGLVEVEVNGEYRRINSTEEVPADVRLSELGFELNRTTFPNSGRKMGVGAAIAEGLKGLPETAWSDTKRQLSFHDGRLTSDDWVALAEVRGLKPVAGIQYCRNIKGWESLRPHLGRFPQLTRLVLDSVGPVSDDDLKLLTGLPTLRVLVFTGSSAQLFTPQGMTALRPLGLTELFIFDGGQFTDDTSDAFAGFTTLTHLGFIRCRVTGAGAKKTAEILPGCRVEWGDGKAVGPLDPDRKAAEYVLLAGGVVRVNGADSDLRAVADLPPEPFRLTGVNLHDNKQVNNDGLTPFVTCKHLTMINLVNTKLSDAGMIYFKGCKDLTHLLLGLTQVGDAGLAVFKDCKRLEALDLNETLVSDTVLAHFKDCKNLDTLNLAHTKIGDAGLAHFKECKKLTTVFLDSTRVSDAGLPLLSDCKQLRQLKLQQTQVTAAGIGNLKQGLPRCRIEWDGEVIDPRK